MSRDFTPMQNYFASLEVDKDFTLLDNFEWHIGDAIVPAYSPEEIECRKNHEYLGRANPDILSAFFGTDQIETIDFLDNEIKKIVEGKEDVDETVRKWFLGQLDPAFYYGETNDELLIEYLEKR